MLTSHELLLKYWHDARFDFQDVLICYVDRGALGDRSCVFGSDIRALESYCFTISSGKDAKYIPYHRIRRILYAGDPVWEHLAPERLVKSQEKK